MIRKLYTEYRVLDLTDNKERNVSLIYPDFKPGMKVPCTIGNIPHLLKIIEVILSGCNE